MDLRRWGCVGHRFCAGETEEVCSMMNVGLGDPASDLQLAISRVFSPKIILLSSVPSIHMKCSFVESDR